MLNFDQLSILRTVQIVFTVDIIQVPSKHQYLNVYIFQNRYFLQFFADWACGGQWNRAYQFVQLLANAFSVAHIEVIAFFDGTLKENKKHTYERNEFRQKTVSVLKHIRMIGTPPPKIWWLPPSGLRTSLRNALRSLNITVVSGIFRFFNIHIYVSNSKY